MLQCEVPPNPFWGPLDHQTLLAQSVGHVVVLPSPPPEAVAVAVHFLEGCGREGHHTPKIALVRQSAGSNESMSFGPTFNHLIFLLISL